MAIHGGAGVRLHADYALQREHLLDTLKVGQEDLLGGIAAVEVVASCIEKMEASGLYVAGKGSAPHSEGGFELDASLMDGEKRRAGAVAALEGIVSPIRAAERILTEGQHVMLAGSGARTAAAAAGLELVDNPNEYYSEHAALGSNEELNHGTVGAVALDLMGRLAAGTSTGGTFNKSKGRVGDTALIGCGTWADDTVAVSCTGTGEAFIRAAAAYDVAARVRYSGEHLGDAAQAVLDEVKNLQGCGGLIALDRKGNIAMKFNSFGLKRAAVSSSMQPVVRVFEID